MSAFIMQSCIHDGNQISKENEASHSNHNRPFPLLFLYGDILFPTAVRH